MERRAIIVIATVALIFSSLTLLSCGGQSPTEVYRAYHAAAKKQDVETMLKYFTNERVKAIRSDPSTYHYLAAYEDKFTGETDGELIDGDHATIRIKNVRGEWSTQEFIREGGSWKLGNW